MRNHIRLLAVGFKRLLSRLQATTAVHGYDECRGKLVHRFLLKAAAH